MSRLLGRYNLSDVLPAKVHLTVPGNWSKRRLRVPQGLVLHFGDLADRDWEWLEAVPITTPRRTLLDCIDAHLAPDLLRQALTQARARGLVSQSDSASLAKCLARIQRGIR